MSQTPPQFDEVIANEFLELTRRLLVQHPELRTVSVVLDYSGRLNEAGLREGIWLGRSGAVQAPDALAGSAGQTLKLLSRQLERGHLLLHELESRLAAVMREYMDKGPRRDHAIGEDDAVRAERAHVAAAPEEPGQRAGGAPLLPGSVQPG